MAKELPYFKFEPAEYITKDISFCSYAAQGLFINLCSHYWQRNCEMTLSQAERRFKDKDLLNELLDEKIISHVNGKLIIKFLIEQRDEAIEKSKVNKANGSLGGRPRKPKQNPKETQNKPNGFNSLTETKGIRRDKIIKDNTYEESVFLENWSTCREHYLKQPTNIKNLNFNERNLFTEIKNEYNKEEINEAMQTLFKQERIPVDAMVLRPKHFLEKFDTYYTGKNNTKIYGSNV